MPLVPPATKTARLVKSKASVRSCAMMASKRLPQLTLISHARGATEEVLTSSKKRDRIAQLCVHHSADIRGLREFPGTVNLGGKDPRVEPPRVRPCQRTASSTNR